MNCGPQKNVVFNIEPADAGVIHLNTILLSDSTWSGIYYTQVPINLEAEALTGYLFSHWSTENGEIVDTTLNSFTTSLNNDSISFTAHFVVDPNAHVNDDTAQTFQLYPNPGNNQFQIQSNEAIENIRIFNSTGICIQQFENLHDRKSTTVDAKDWSTGIYFVVIKQNGKLVTKRWVKN
jgi:hypothetical protein